ncbi:hypothetical protein QBC38DRAFT_462070 [Podospora fimiseda]|uniref:Uncharacterized protein n=1 Tax=Podospora fimiseda TaxID=252190 RepID=A0AAN6YM47_9PEZI|nr:hypothetical protein QBC38DRAFT_462070 [Podospora fimiseda]
MPRKRFARSREGLASTLEPNATVTDRKITVVDEYRHLILEVVTEKFIEQEQTASETSTADSTNDQRSYSKVSSTNVKLGYTGEYWLTSLTWDSYPSPLDRVILTKSIPIVGNLMKQIYNILNVENFSGEIHKHCGIGATTKTAATTIFNAHHKLQRKLATIPGSPSYDELKKCHILGLGEMSKGWQALDARYPEHWQDIGFEPRKVAGDDSLARCIK